MSKFTEYRCSKVSWGNNVLGSFCVEIGAIDGTRGFATGFGAPPACWMAQNHFLRFLDPRDINILWDKMFRASMFYGRKGIILAVMKVFLNEYF